MKTICFFNRKGGAGKTSLSFLFARYLSAAGEKVLYLDLDPQRTATNHFARLEEISRDRYLNQNAFGVLMGKTKPEEAILPAGPNLDLLPGSFDLSEIQATCSPFVLKELAGEIQDRYTFLIQDHAPNFSNLIQAGLVSAQVILIPTLPAIEDLEQAEWSLAKARKLNPEAEIKIILNQYKPGKLERELLEHFAPLFEGALMKASVPPSNLVRKYTATGERINSTAKTKQKFMEALEQFVGEATGRTYQLEMF